MASVRALILRGETVLMLQRGPDISLPHYWCLPGGRLDPDESPQRACLREVQEETGLLVTIRRPLFRAGSCDYFHCVLTPPEQTVVLQQAECQAYAWARAGMVHQLGPIMDMRSLRHILRLMGL